MKAYVEVLEDAIEQYVGLPVLNRIKAYPANALAIYQQLIEATMLFMDVRSFSQLAKSIPLDSLMSELNNYLSKMSEIIVHHHGFIDSVIGDEIFLNRQG
jgi:adenylate cyclase